MTHMLLTENTIYTVGNKIASSSPLVPYDRTVCEFLNDLSSELRSSAKASEYADIMTFAFWCRKANISRFRADFKDGRARLGLGTVFHITPSNVPVNFAFSFAFGLLSGNANIVRVPSKQTPQVDIICAAIDCLFKQDKYSEIMAMTAFVRYERNDEVTGSFSAECDARIIWGGDSTIRNIRKLPIPEHGKEIVFADRYSFCVINAPSVIELDDDGLKKLAQGFYNDTYSMDQNACSSPHLIVWQGEDRETAREKFWTAVYQTVQGKYQLADVSAVDKFTLFCKNAIDLENIISFRKNGNHVYRITLDSLPDNMHTLRGKCGYFYEYDTQDLNSISHIINNRYQTMTYFGPDKSDLLDFVIKNRLSGIDRIVPVGEALDIDVIWDGYDIVGSLSRIIDVK